MYAKIRYGFRKKRSTVSSICSLSCEKSERNWYLHRETKARKAKNPRILLLWQKVCTKCRQYQSTVVLNNRTFRTHHWDEFCIKTSICRRTKFNWFRSWSQLTIQCVFASLSGPAITLQKMSVLAKSASSVSRSQAHFPALFKHIHNHIRSAAG